MEPTTKKETKKEIPKKELQPIDDIFQMIRAGDYTTMSEIRNQVQSPLVQYSLKLIAQGDLKRNDSVLKLLDIVCKYSEKSVKAETNDYISFLEGIKK